MFTVIELQTTDDVTTVVPPVTYEDRGAALSKFHTVLSFAAVSQVRYHTCMVVDEKGQYIARECYEHEPQIEGGEEE